MSRTESNEHKIHLSLGLALHKSQIQLLIAGRWRVGQIWLLSVGLLAVNRLQYQYLI